MQTISRANLWICPRECFNSIGAKVKFPFEVLGSFNEGAVNVQHCQFPERV